MIRFPTNQHLREPRVNKASPSCPRLSPGRAMCRKALATLFPLSLVIVETQHALTAPSGWASVEAGERETVEHGQNCNSRAPKKTLRGRWWDLWRLACRRLSFRESISPVHACSVPHLTFSIGTSATLPVHEACHCPTGWIRVDAAVGYLVLHHPAASQVSLRPATASHTHHVAEVPMLN